MIKIFTGDEQCNSYLFNMDNQTCIIIGRDSSLCDVIVEDKMLSRIHCCINYKDNGKNEKGWYIKDGNMEGKKSTNDTWFYSAEETLIYDKMIFKTNHILFKCIYK
jgi:pSer/pThr/pTyr-binding forkhead associated (FHA) protein